MHSYIYWGLFHFVSCRTTGRINPGQCNSLVFKGTDMSHFFLTCTFFFHFPSCCANCPSLWLFIHSTRNQCAVKKPVRRAASPRRSDHHRRSKKEADKKRVNHGWCGVVELGEINQSSCALNLPLFLLNQAHLFAFGGGRRPRGAHCDTRMWH